MLISLSDSANPFLFIFLPSLSSPVLYQEWIQQNHILSIVLRDSLHQPQYVEKLEKILRFVIKEKALTMQDLDNIWAAQVSYVHPLNDGTETVLILNRCVGGSVWTRNKSGKHS